MHLISFLFGYFEVVYCFTCGRRRVAVARYRMICLVLSILISQTKKVICHYINFTFLRDDMEDGHPGKHCQPRSTMFSRGGDGMFFCRIGV